MIATNLQIIHEKIAFAAAKVRRSPDEIKLVAVSKYCSVNKITEAHAAGHTIFGENYIQELQMKREQTPPTALFHFIGHLQSNKARIAAETCNMVETVDSFKLGRTLNTHLENLNKTLDVLIQVNIGQDEKKAGVESDETEDLLVRLNDLPRIRVCGLMTMPPFETEPEQSRPYFKNLRLLAEKLRKKGLFPAIKEPELSMGMSNDFHIAIEEGATIIRVGTAIFGPRG